MVSCLYVHVSFALNLEKIWTGTMSVPSPLLISTIGLFIFTNAFRNGSVFAGRTTFSSAAEMNGMSEYGTVS